MVYLIEAFYFSCDSIKVVTETWSKYQVARKIAWDRKNRSTTTRETNNQPASIEGRRGRSHVAAGPKWLSGTEATAAAASSYRHLLKGLCSRADFYGDGHALSQHEHQVGSTGGTRGMNGDTELLG